MNDTTILSIEHIVRTPGIVGGKPRIAGRRLPVHHIVYAHERQGFSVEWLAETYELTSAQVYAALTYYHDHKDEIDQIMREEDDLVEQLPDSVWQEADVLNAVMTVTEIAQTYHLDPGVIRKTCLEGWIPARKSGSAWLIRRHDAEERWGKRRKKDEEKPAA